MSPRAPLDALDDLAEFVSMLKYDDIPVRVRDIAKVQIADSVGVIARGSIERESQAYTRTIARTGHARVIAIGFPEAGEEDAAAANAIALCTLEMDEGSLTSLGHPAGHVLPALLARAQVLDATGEELLTAFVAGYEVYARIKRAASLRYEVHPHGHLGTVAAAAALAKISGRTATETRRSMDVAAGLMAVTLWTACLDGATVRNAFMATSARSAFFADALSDANFRGSRTATAEVLGSLLGTAFAVGEVTRDLGRRYDLENSFVKFHSCCGLLHPTLDAVFAAIGTARRPGAYPAWQTADAFAPDRIDRVRVRVVERAMRLAVQARGNALSARFSIPHAVAVALVRGDTGPSAFTDQAANDMRVRALAARVTVESDAALTAAFPAHHGAAVDVELVDGTHLRSECADPFGVPSSPASGKDVEAKFVSLASAALPRARVGALWSRIQHVEEATSMRPFFELAHPGPRTANALAPH